MWSLYCVVKAKNVYAEAYVHANTVAFYLFDIEMEHWWILAKDIGYLVLKFECVTLCGLQRYGPECYKIEGGKRSFAYYTITPPAPMPSKTSLGAKWL